MKARWIAAVAVAAGLMAPGGMLAAKAYATPQNGYYQQQGGWDQPPQEYREWQRRGFHDGVEGARKDYENHRSPNVRNRDEFRHPNAPREFRRDYRDGFRRGYEMAEQHMMGDRGHHHDHDHDHDHD